MSARHYRKAFKICFLNKALGSADSLRDVDIKQCELIDGSRAKTVVTLTC